MRSIRSQLTVSLLAGLLLLFVVCGGVLYLYVRHALLTQFDKALLGKARAFAAMSEQDEEWEEEDEKEVAFRNLPTVLQEAIKKHAAGAFIAEVERSDRDGALVYKVEVIRNGMESEFAISANGEYLGLDDEFDSAFGEAALPEFQPSSDAEYYQVWGDDGEIMAKSPSLGGANLEQIRPRADGLRFCNSVLPDGRPGRAVALRFVPRTEGRGGRGGVAENADASREQVTLVMARSRTELNRALGVLLSGLLVTGMLLLTTAGLLVRWAVQRGLRPLDAVANEAATIDAGHLAHRFPTGRMPQEMLPICVRLNELLERLEAAFRREHRFTSDVAHELRTPIAELRSLAEVALRSAPSFTQDRELPQYFRDALDIAAQMERLVSALLTLSRCESGLQVVDVQRVEVTALVEDAWRPFQQRARERELSVDLQLLTQAYIETDRTLLTAMLTNLLSNAVAYTTRNGKIRLEVASEENAVVFALSNSNDELEREDLAHLFEAFWRKDTARSDSAHSGVGLSVVAAFARLLGMDVMVDLPTAELFQITLRHPKRIGGKTPPESAGRPAQ